MLKEKAGPCAGVREGPPLRFPFYAPETVRRGEVRPSRMGKRRAAVLIGIHVLILLHILHWKLSGRTVAPLEPSEAVYTFTEGVINAGVILLGLSLLSTLVLGRFFCGWACHLVALQDLSAWLLKKLGIRPRPLRSRLLVFVPLLSGLYMFGWPLLLRWMHSEDAPPYHLGLTKTAFWETFPGFWLALLTFVVCGFVMIYLLGAKGFCTYACPYGGLFRVLDRLAPGRILVSDACKGCGHCSAICTSNVLVHQEVREYGMVVDPGCMKCQDCVSVCPEGALRFGFARPALLARARVRKTPRTWTFGWRGETLLVLVFGVSMVVFWGLPPFVTRHAGRLYGELPLLLSLGLSAITAFVAAFLLRVVRGGDLDFQNLTLRLDGRLTRRGWLFAAAAGAWLLFVGHSGWVQVHMFQAERHLERTAPLHPAVWTQDRAVLGRLEPEMAEAVARSEAHYLRAEAIGLFPDLRIPRQLAWLDLVKGNPPAAIRRLAEASRRHPDHAPYHYDLAQVLGARGEIVEAARRYRRALERDPNHARAREALVPVARGLMARGEFGEAAAVLAIAVEMAPDHAQLREAFSAALLGSGRTEEAAAALREVVRRWPDRGAARLQLAALLLDAEDLTEGLRELEAAARLLPEDDREARLNLGEVYLRLGRLPEAEAEFRRALAADPRHPRAAALLDELLRERARRR